MPYRKLSLLEKLDIPLGLLQAVIGTIFTLVLAPFRGPNSPKSLKRHLLLTVTRKVLSRLSPEQLQSIAGTTESNYVAWAKSNNLTPKSVYLKDIDTKAFWIGNPEAENVVLYYHGGGFAMPVNDGHLLFSSTLVSNASRSGKSLAVLLLQYDLAPGGKYPRQLIQAVELIRYLTTDLNKSSKNIILMGDSAGGNIILGVLSHLMHPNPSMKSLKLSDPLRAALLSSPVTILNTENERFRTHEEQDPASAETIRTWLNNLLGSTSTDPWNEPLKNEASWWRDLPSVIDEILITVASNEMMAEDTCALAAKIKTTYSDITLFESDVDFHAQPGIGPALGLELGEAAEVMISWAIERA